ncbi:MAG: histidine--tRNA ligase [Bernardetiaceae bacterium]
MAGIKPSIPKGTRDFNPEELSRRQYIFQTIQTVFERYGFDPIQTPVMENLQTLTGKYGDEGDQLVFKILNSGDFLKKITPAMRSELDYQDWLPKVAEKGLRYDLTVPFARYVVMHQHELTFPFRRYQIAPVWRADRPQRGRYREFVQCDADVIGTKSLIVETELLQIFDEVFTALGLPVVIKINHRQILQGLAEKAGIPNQMMEMTIALDKIEKIGWGGVVQELQKAGVVETATDVIADFVSISQKPDFSTADLSDFFGDQATAQQAIQDLNEVQTLLASVPFQQNLRLDASLARGLNYYTGCIFEVVARDVPMGSIAAGGRYDDLTGVFGLPDVSGVGISFGADRVYDVLEQSDLFPAHTQVHTRVLLVGFDEAARRFLFPVLRQLRDAGLRTELYPQQSKLKKALDYANKKTIPYVVLVGEDEMQSGHLTLKNMQSGEQISCSVEELVRNLSVS